MPAQGVKSAGGSHSVALFLEHSEQSICPPSRRLSWKCGNATDEFLENVELPIGVSARCEYVGPGCVLFFGWRRDALV